MGALSFVYSEICRFLLAVLNRLVYEYEILCRFVEQAGLLQGKSWRFKSVEKTIDHSDCIQIEAGKFFFYGGV